MHFVLHIKNTLKKNYIQRHFKRLWNNLVRLFRLAGCISDAWQLRILDTLCQYSLTFFSQVCDLWGPLVAETRWCKPTLAPKLTSEKKWGRIFLNSRSDRSSSCIANHRFIVHRIQCIVFALKIHYCYLLTSANSLVSYIVIDPKPTSICHTWKLWKKQALFFL